ncbi:hypothetical protein DUNSADRAFT_9312 [Dunaliella salina]|uniref:Encoded protein n=1 Tax=Dunaliella salina TaxID=3046 RepID=A0ABQ7GHN2_DUNSA|nr:hypothetical protein DUNSADRAFT_9312 [Dunaliella salina]|eukprot:KAF5834116.1 hypothetical protein DUNSADRAFT_9312 [Dunaliella salina]
MTNSDSSESCIRLRLTVNKVGRELIKRVTAKGNEVVEVNGFTFVRKRKPSPENDAAAQHNNSAKRQLLAAQERPTHGAIVGEEQEEGLNGAVQGEPAACKGNVLSSPACQEGSMEADAVHTGEGDSQIQVQLLPNTEAHVHFAGTVAPGAPGTSAAQGSPKPAGPASPMQPLLLPQIPPGLPAGAPAADIGLLTAERLGAQLASYLPASCPKLVKLHFVVARALDAAAAQVSVGAKGSHN